MSHSLLILECVSYFCDRCLTVSLTFAALFFEYMTFHFAKYENNILYFNSVLSILHCILLPVGIINTCRVT